MGRIVVNENVTLDGVVEDPTGEDGFARGGWFQRIGAEDREAWAQVEREEALAAEALLLGRRTYEYLAARFPSRTGEWADRLNAMPKYVVSATANELTWHNSTVLSGDVLDEAAKLKDRLDGDIVVYSSRRLVRTLIEHDLVDELRLIVYPFVLGAGARVFGETSDTKPLRLVDARPLGAGLAYLAYQPVLLNAAPPGSV
jgi:dihydrofolate reductase